MFKLYLNYWKRIFDYKGTSDVIEILIALAGDFLVIIFLNILGIVIPISWENSLVNFLYIVKLAMIVPAISLLVRVLNKY
ncbi:TPA: hypothetical protein ACN3I6_002148 [Enterococcus faecalis]|jgi:hypothetical protein|uniref:hypothetical protein n=1 Tax=Enterococcus faecalis TaxID=1351 RepID=UPI0001B2B5AD|nr:hypothetical protein [Enterococcus faecalis]EEU65341.1 predicted protein [Enterococcus faecalis DS5]EFT48104.1 hypothetical protein HMPREF9501_01011 [Enterococcus faecalis TX0027]EGO8281220.1 hypothetical protein [Enterococcus faecalis]EHT2879937.1 hypothetical protein [Enterococcus faecalis]EJR1556170.1 hypothetical protein [Enterococcus faecalis]